MLKCKIGLFISAISLTSTVLAIQETPVTCPSISAIQTVGVDKVMNAWGIYYVGTINNFGTNSNWKFFMGPVQGQSVDEALKAGNKLLSEMLVMKESKQDANGVWECECKFKNPETICVAAQTQIPTFNPGLDYYHNIIN